MSTLAETRLRDKGYLICHGKVSVHKALNIRGHLDYKLLFWDEATALAKPGQNCVKPAIINGSDTKPHHSGGNTSAVVVSCGSVLVGGVLEMDTGLRIFEYTSGNI